MPRIQQSAGTTRSATTINCEPEPDAPAPPTVPLTSNSPPITTTTTTTTTTAPTTTTNKSYGFGEGVCTCARCMRRAGPIREDVDERIVQIAYVLAGVYADTPNPEEHVKSHHRERAGEFMTMVEEGNVAGLRGLFDSVSGEDTVAEEIATELIISASQLGQADIVKLLKERGADVEEKDLRRGGRPLMHAANNGHTAAVKALLDAGADTEARDDNGYTALMVSIFSDRSSAAEALLAAGAQVDAVDEKGRTAMSYAALYGSTDCIHLLFTRGANVFHADKEGNAPLELAEDSGRTQAVDALKKLQVKYKMQERRKHKQKSQKCKELTEAELKRKEVEAAEAAHLLLLELEAEETRKQAKASKKSKKKGKAKHQAEEPQQAGPKEAKPQPDQPQIKPHTSTSHPSSDPHKPLPSASTADASPPTLQPHTSPHPTRSPTPPDASTSPHARPPSVPNAPWLDGILIKKLTLDPSPGHASPPNPTSPIPAGTEVDVEALRRKWEEILDEGAKCRDPKRQPELQELVDALLPLCVEHGISVKYGRKVLQRLQAVGPAREVLAAAMAAQPVVRSELDAALKQARPARSLLAPGMVEEAEALLARVKAEEQEKTWSTLASALSWESTRSSGSPSGPGSQYAVGADGAATTAVFGRLASRLVTQSSGMLADGEADIDADQECVVCLSEVKNVCCVPCGHVCMCQGCAEEVQSANGACPVCRAEIQCVIEIMS